MNEERDGKVREVVADYFDGRIDYNAASNRLAGMGVPWEEAADLLAD